jgi:LPS-assembly protein
VLARPAAMKKPAAHGGSPLREGIFYALALGTTLATGFSWAAYGSNSPFGSAPPSHPVRAKAPVISSTAPVLLEAQRMDYDKESDVVIATGNVEVTQGETILLADRITYDRPHNKVHARGNVAVLEPSGNVYFAESAELVDEMKSGVIEHFQGKLSDGSLFAAREARKIDENKTVMTKAVYSPCSLCTLEGKPKRPLWEVRAHDVTYDKAAQDITYHDAMFDFYGVPVMYTPYLSHAAPGADNKSGFLIPEYRHNNTLGTVVKMPYYYAIAPDKDMTITPISTTLVGPLLAGEYRQRFDKGNLYFDGSITNPSNLDVAGNEAAGHEVRGHINGSGQFRMSSNEAWGFDVHRTTDDTYLRRYGFSNDTYLTSRAYFENANFLGNSRRSYSSVQGISFQGLTAQDDNRQLPLVLPLADFSYESDPMFAGSRFGVTANALSLTRDLGTDTRRLSLAGKWRLPYITSDGQIIEFSTELRGDAYDVTDLSRPGNSEFNGSVGRLFPQSALRWRYPFIHHFDGASLILEPNVMLVASPNQGDDGRIPNEDSRFPEFTDANLFSTDRFPGYDRIEGGMRSAYGLRGEMQIQDTKNIYFLIGQSALAHPNPHFPYSNDLTSHLSDYVGNIGLSYRPVDITYRFRLDRENMTPERQEVDTSLTLKRMRFGVSYLMLNDDPIVSSKRQISTGGQLELTDNWSILAGVQRDLLLEQNTAASMGLEFHNECLTIDTLMARDYTRDRDVIPGNSIMLRVHLKNLD